MKKRIAILGSTGSIGNTVLDLIDKKGIYFDLYNKQQIEEKNKIK